jgi:ABC-2 type transport system permease protein
VKALIKAEVRKLLTIRSTYILTIIAFVLIGILTFWAMGYKGDSGSKLLMEAVMEGVGMMAIFVALVAALNITHEYRYNTIMYTLTSANSRSKVLLAKVLVLMGFSLLLVVVASGFAALMAWLGASMKPIALAPQVFNFWDTAWRILFSVEAWAMLGLLFGFLFRHVVGAIVALFLLPSTVEGLLSLILKDNIRYLPYTALEQVHGGSLLSPTKGALVFSAWLVGGWLVAWFLFLKRDAN